MRAQATRELDVWQKAAKLNPTEKAWLPSCGGAGGAWLQPPSDPSHHMADDVFSAAIQLRLGLDVVTASATCPFRRGSRYGPSAVCCGAQVDPKAAISSAVSAELSSARDTMNSVMQWQAFSKT